MLFFGITACSILVFLLYETLVFIFNFINIHESMYKIQSGIRFDLFSIILSDPIFRLIFLFYLYFDRKLENFQKFVNSIPYKFYFQVKYIQKIVKIWNIVYIMVGTISNKYFLWMLLDLSKINQRFWNIPSYFQIYMVVL
jgi:hypothetical protein